jgi:hypothetical protein
MAGVLRKKAALSINSRTGSHLSYGGGNGSPSLLATAAGARGKALREAERVAGRLGHLLRLRGQACSVPCRRCCCCC